MDEEEELYEYGDVEYAEAPDTETHRERFQYIDRTHANKREARRNKVKADGFDRASVDDPAFRISSFTLSSLATWHAAGATLRRLPMSSDPTRFVLMDIDHKLIAGTVGAPISGAELSSALRTAFGERTEYTVSTSGKPGNWHVFVLLDSPVYPEDYADAFYGCDRKLAEALLPARGIAVPEGFRLTDPAMSSVNQVMYGVSQEKAGTLVIPELFVSPEGSSVYVSNSPHLEITNPAPEPRPTDPYFDGDGRRYVAATPSKFASYLKDWGVLPEGRVELEYAFTCWLPYMKRGKGKRAWAKIPAGERSSKVAGFGYGLYGCFRAWNLYLGTHGLQKYTHDEFMASFKRAVYGCFEDTPDFNVGRLVAQIGKYARECDIAWPDDRAWCEHFSAFAVKGRDGMPRHDFRSSDYVMDAVERIDMAGPPSSKKEVQEKLEEYGVSYATYKRHTVYRDRLPGRGHGAKGRSGAKPTVELAEVLSRISGKVDGTTVFYGGKILDADRRWLQRHGFKVKKRTFKIRT